MIGLDNDLNELTDDDVISKVRDGYTRHFEILINRYKKKIVNFIHKMIFDYDEAQSLAQDVFVKVYQTIANYQMQDNFQAFVFTIAKNLTLNYIKKQKRMSWFSSSLPASTEEKHFRVDGTQHADMERSQQETALTEGLKKLKENQRVALIMKVYMELSYNKIAKITGWSVPKIETLISRAKSSLKDIVRSNYQFQDPGPGPAKKTRKQNENLQENVLRNVLKVR